MLRRRQPGDTCLLATGRVAFINLTSPAINLTSPALNSTSLISLTAPLSFDRQISHAWFWQRKRFGLNFYAHSYSLRGHSRCPRRPNSQAAGDFVLSAKSPGRAGWAQCADHYVVRSSRGAGGYQPRRVSNSAQPHGGRALGAWVYLLKRSRL